MNSGTIDNKERFYYNSTIDNYFNLLNSYIEFHNVGVESLINRIYKDYSEEKLNDAFIQIQKTLINIEFKDQLNNEIKIYLDKLRIISSNLNELYTSLKYINEYLIYFKLFEDPNTSILSDEQKFNSRPIFRKKPPKKNDDIFEIIKVNNIQTIELVLNSIEKDNILESGSLEDFYDFYHKFLVCIKIINHNIYILETSLYISQNNFFKTLTYLKLNFNKTIIENTDIFINKYAESLFESIIISKEVKINAKTLTALYFIFKENNLFQKYLKDETYIQWANKYYTFKRLLKQEKDNVDIEKYIPLFNKIKKDNFIKMSALESLMVLK
jgi:hypothetical protein